MHAFPDPARRIQTTISSEGGGKTLLAYLSERFTYHSPVEWQVLIESGAILLNRVDARPGAVLTPGDVVSFSLENRAEPPVSSAFAICWEDESFLLVNKPPNLPVHPAGRYFKHTLWYELQRRGIAQTPCIVNRLDRETSGLLLVAKTPEAAGAAQRLFQRGAVSKHYLALVEGDFRAVADQTALYCSGKLFPAGGIIRKKRALQQPVLSQTPPGSEGKEWVLTRFRCRSFFAENGVSLVEAQAVTGRLHQIRASLRSLGYPVVGDKLYGVDERLFLAFLSDSLSPACQSLLRLPHQALHAARMVFRHPLSGAVLDYEVPPPETWSAVMV